MIADDLQIVHLDGPQWGHLLALLARLAQGAGDRADAGGGRRRARARGRGWLLLFVAGGRVVRALRFDPGAEATPIDPASVPWQGPATPLAPIRRAHGVARVVALEEGALPALLHEAEAAVAAGAPRDYGAQLLALARAARRRLRPGGGLRVEPRGLLRLPLPSFAVLQATFDRLWPDGRTLVLYVIDEAADDAHASLLLRKEHGDVTLLTTNAALGDGVPRLGRAWRRACPDVLAAVEARLGPPHIGLFLDVETWRRVAAGPPGTFARERASGHVVLDPAPPWLEGALGVAAAVARLRALLGRRPQDR